MREPLVAKEGYVYTNGETASSIIRLGVNDSANNWHEITKAEYEKILEKEHEEI